MIGNKISVCIIAKNEEQLVRSCIESVRTIAYEIILGDTGSSDRTAEAAEQAGAKVLQIGWSNDFSAARNKVIDAATGDFILVIDADERLINPDAVIKAIEGLPNEIGGLLVDVSSKAERAGGAVDYYSAMLLRIFRNLPAIRFSGKIHEQAGAAITALGLGIAPSGIIFEHLGYNLGLEKMKEKQERNLKMLSAAIDDNGKDPYLLYQRGRTHLAFNHLPESENDFKSALELLDANNPQRAQVLNYYSISKFKQKDVKEARRLAELSLGIVHVQSFANYILGEIFLEEKNYVEAYEHFKAMNQALESKDINSRLIGDYSMPKEHVCFKLGKCLLGLNLLEEAVKEFEEGILSNPYDTGCLVGLANIAFKLGELANARALLAKALEAEPESKEIPVFIDKVEKAIASRKSSSAHSYLEKTKDTPLLTLSMIVKNEEQYLRGCLESVQGLVDEVVIVDTGSVDHTIEIAREFGAKIYYFEWCNDFAAARNESLQHCTGEWVLYLDADERITHPDAESIRNMLKIVPDKVGGLICTIESDHARLDGDTELHRGGYPRLFRNLGYPAISFRGRVHEQISPSILDRGLGFTSCDIIIEHLGYNQSREVMEQKIKRNYSMLIQHVNEDPTNSYAWYQLGQTLGQMKLTDHAENAIKFAIQCGDLSPTIYASAAATLAQLAGNSKRFDEALKWSEESLKNAPNQIYARNLKAYSLYHLNRLEEAEQAFIDVLELMAKKKGVPQTGFDIDIPEKVVTDGLSRVRSLLGKKP